MNKSKSYSIVLIGLFVAIMAVCAWVSIPMVPIPVTLQTMGVFITASILGAKKGTVSIIIYILLGAIGLPVFSNFTGGFGVLLSPTGGFIIGFILTTIITGFITEYFKSKIYTSIIAMTLGLVACYSIGTLWYCIYASVDILTALLVCVVPFLIGDAVKIGVSAILVDRLKKIIIP